MSRIKGSLFIVCLLAYECNTYLANDMILPMMHQICTYFKQPYHAQPLGIVLFLAGGLFQLPIGWAADHWGPRPILIISACVFFLSLIMTAFAPTWSLFLIGRLISGLSLSSIGTGYVMVHQYHDEKSAITITSVMSNIALAAPILGPLMGSVLNQHAISWQQACLMQAFLACIIAIGLHRHTPRPSIRPSDHHAPSHSSDACEKITSYLALCQLIYRSPFAKGSIALGFLVAPVMIWIADGTWMMASHSSAPNFYFSISNAAVFIAMIAGSAYMRRTLIHQNTVHMLNQYLHGSFLFISLACLISFFFGPSSAYIWIPTMTILFGIADGMLYSGLYRLTLYTIHDARYRNQLSAIMGTCSILIYCISIFIFRYFYRIHPSHHIFTIGAWISILIFFVTARSFLKEHSCTTIS